MKSFLESIVKSIVESPESVIIEESTDDQGRVVFSITVADEDMGRVIGKDGKVINAIRAIMRVMAIRQNVRIRIDVVDPKRGNKEVVAETTDPQAEQATENETVLVDNSKEPELEI